MRSEFSFMEPFQCLKCCCYWFVVYFVFRWWPFRCCCCWCRRLVEKFIKIASGPGRRADVATCNIIFVLNCAPRLQMGSIIRVFICVSQTYLQTPQKIFRCSKGKGKAKEKHPLGGGGECKYNFETTYLQERVERTSYIEHTSLPSNAFQSLALNENSSPAFLKACHKCFDASKSILHPLVFILWGSWLIVPSWRCSPFGILSAFRFPPILPPCCSMSPKSIQMHAATFKC